MVIDNSVLPLVYKGIIGGWRRLKVRHLVLNTTTNNYIKVVIIMKEIFIYAGLSVTVRTLETQFILNKAITKNTIWIICRTYITKCINLWIKLIQMVTSLWEPLTPMYSCLK